MAHLSLLLPPPEETHSASLVPYAFISRHVRVKREGGWAGQQRNNVIPLSTWSGGPTRVEDSSPLCVPACV